METKVNIYGRLSYAHVWDANPKNGKYSCSLIIDPADTKQLEKIKRAIEAAKVAGKSKLADARGNVPKLLKTPLRDADEEGKTDAGYEGMMWFNATSNQKPQIVDKSISPILDRASVYSGCYVWASINFYAYATDGNKGIAAGLGNIMFVKDGEPLGGGSSAAQDFADLASAEDDFLNL